MNTSKSRETCDTTQIFKRFAFILIVILTQAPDNGCDCKPSPSLWTGTLTQSTFYYADYKLPPKSLKLKRLFLPGPQNCPETGFTVCKDVTTFPENEAFEIIRTSTAERFNLSSVFADDSANDEEPIFEPSDAQEPETQKPSQEGYIVYQTALHYNYAPESVYPTQHHKGYGHDVGYRQSSHTPNQRNYGKPQQDTSYQNFDQTFDHGFDQSYGHKYDRSSKSNAEAQNKDQTFAGNYDHISTQNVGQFIDSQITKNLGKTNTNGNKGIDQVQVSKTNGKGQSGRSRPTYRSPVARGLALSGQKGQKKEPSNQGFDSKGVKGGKEAVKGGKDGTKTSKPTVKGSPSTVSKQRSPVKKNPESAITVSPHNFNKNPWRPIFSKRSTVDTNVTEEENHISNKTSDANELQRPKRQTDDGEEICRTRKMYITPKAALNDKSEWKYIINLGEKDPQLKQVIKVDVCVTPGEPCSNQISLPFGFVSRCKQKYLKKKLLSLDADGEGTSTENFFVPSCCVCEIIRPNKRK